MRSMRSRSRRDDAGWTRRGAAAYSIELLRGAAVQTAVLDVGLLGERLDVLDGRRESFGREEGGQVGRVR